MTVVMTTIPKAEVSLKRSKMAEREPMATAMRLRNQLQSVYGVDPLRNEVGTGYLWECWDVCAHRSCRYTQEAPFCLWVSEGRRGAKRNQQRDTFHGLQQLSTAFTYACFMTTGKKEKVKQIRQHAYIYISQSIFIPKHIKNVLRASSHTGAVGLAMSPTCLFSILRIILVSPFVW